MNNEQMYNIATENELAVVLSHYNSEFVLSVLDQAIKNRFTSVSFIQTPNIVEAWEQNFKAIQSTYGEEVKSEVLKVREEVYNQIIEVICREFHLNFTIDDSVDLYTAAFYLYDFFVCNFTNGLITFFANFIYREKDNLYDSLELAELKKNKDTSTIYGRKVYKDIKIALINANIDRVITEICQMSIPFHGIIEIVFGMNSHIKDYILSIVSCNDNFFGNAYVSLIESDIRSEIITAIRFKLQEILMANDQTVDSSEIDNLIVKEED